MGVVHKLKDEVVQFIIQKQKEDPSLSCRALSSIVEERFGQKVSKSSINNVLKKANLSNTVGRRKGIKGSRRRKEHKTFRLSTQKKKNLFPDISQNCILSDITEVPQKEGVIDGIGSIFLKAAEWELARAPILERFLKENCPGVSDTKIRAVAAVSGFLKAFHLESLESISRYAGQGLWALNGIESPLLERDILDVMEGIKDRQNVFLKFSLSAPQIFTKVSGFRFVLKDGSNFFIDGQTASCWKNIQKNFSVSLVKATDCLARILNNVQTVVLCSISPKETGKIQETRHIFDFIYAFENVQSKKIQKVELLDEEGQILGDFDKIPHIKRDFIAGVWPWEGLFQRFLDVKKVSREGKIDHTVTGQDLNFKEIVLKYGSETRPVMVRGIVLSEIFLSVPFVVLLTNMDEEKVSAEDIVQRYCQRWPHMEKGCGFSIIKDIGRWGEDFSTESSSFWNVFLSDIPYGRDPVWLAVEQLSMLLDRFAKQQFFPENCQKMDFYTMQNRFYNLSGRVFNTEDNARIEICIPEDYPYLDDLDFAAQRVNESGILDFSDRRISIKIHNN